MRDYYTLLTPDRQKEASSFRVIDTHIIYTTSNTITLAYECNDGLVTTIVCEKVGE